MVKRKEKNSIMQTWFVTYMSHTSGLLHTMQFTVNDLTELYPQVQNIPDVRTIVSMVQWLPPILEIGIPKDKKTFQINFTDTNDLENQLKSIIDTIFKQHQS